MSHQASDDLLSAIPAPGEAIELAVPETGMVEDEQSAMTVISDGEWAAFTTSPCSPEESAKLSAPFDMEAEWDILPTGEPYVSHRRYRARLVEVFGAMGWGLRPLEPIRFDADTNIGYQHWALYARGRVVGRATGSSRWHESNAQKLDFADMAEAIKSNALTRICKDLANMGAELTDKRLVKQFREQFCRYAPVRMRSGEVKRYWRRLDGLPFPYEVEDEGPATPAARPGPRPVARPAATPAPTPDRPAEVSGGSRTRATGADGLITGLSIAKRGKNRNGEYTLYKIVIDGEDFFTFDGAIAVLAEEAQQAGRRVHVVTETKPGQSGRAYQNIKSLDVLAPAERVEAPAEDDIPF